MSEIVNPNDDTAAQTPAQVTEPAAVPAAAPTAAASATVDTQRSPGWFSSGWRYIVAAAAIVLVAGAFFTIGWFTSTRGDDDHFLRAREFGQSMDGRWWDFRQGDGRERQDGVYERGRGWWPCPNCPQGRSDGQPAPQVPSTPQTPSGPQAPTADQGYLGIRMTTVTPALQERFDVSGTSGALVISVDRTGPAFQAGLRRGDIITAIDGTSVTTPEDVVNLVKNKRPGDSLTVVVDREGQSLTLQVTLGSWPTAVSG